MKINIKEAVRQEVCFDHYQGGNLWYVADNGDLTGQPFPVPIADIGGAVFKYRDKGILFMRYMRKWNDSIDDAQKEEMTV